MQITYLPVFPERPTNPARTNVRTGEIEINAKRWKQLRPETQEYVLLHEIGHHKEQTFDEVAADRYALRHLALKKPYSLWNYYQSVYEVSYGNPERMAAAQHDTLKIAAENGSKEAQELLRRYYAAADGDGEQSNKTLYVLAIVLAIAVIVYFVKFKKHG